eukprot:UN12383
MHSQDRNSYDKMFGGFLMKKAVDVATSCVRVFLNIQKIEEIPLLLGATDINFFSSVEIGQIINI